MRYTMRIEVGKTTEDAITLEITARVEAKDPAEAMDKIADKFAKKGYVIISFDEVICEDASRNQC